ncbi:hypothetical protein Ga0451573_001830 [Peptococcaceae bacterium DYL19]|nr:hypothetical protein [Phosphitispora fastidiosa]
MILSFLKFIAEWYVGLCTPSWKYEKNPTYPWLAKTDMN